MERTSQRATAPARPHATLPDSAALLLVGDCLAVCVEGRAGSPMTARAVGPAGWAPRASQERQRLRMQGPRGRGAVPAPLPPAAAPSTPQRHRNDIATLPQQRTSHHHSMDLGELMQSYGHAAARGGGAAPGAARPQQQQQYAATAAVMWPPQGALPFHPGMLMHPALLQQQLHLHAMVQQAQQQQQQQQHSAPGGLLPAPSGLMAPPLMQPAYAAAPAPSRPRGRGGARASNASRSGDDSRGRRPPPAPAKRAVVSESPEELRAWIEERRKRFPRLANANANATASSSSTSTTNSSTSTTNSTSTTSSSSVGTQQDPSQREHDEHDSDSDDLQDEETLLRSQLLMQKQHHHHHQPATDADAVTAEPGELAQALAAISRDLASLSGDATAVDISAAAASAAMQEEPEEVAQQQAREAIAAAAAAAAASMSTARPRKRCEFFSRPGGCKWRAKCRYDHSNPPSDGSPMAVPRAPTVREQRAVGGGIAR